ncbi:TetR/AcrR family transcriptional regulator [Flavobacterium sp. 3HN19-14]|uniref:TetR/AcrR family transcriptional regulator n=1 Tax=Flavobacterium sp. 3HN19-14 TaxID=3448133 RepID=UPI003EE0BA47
MRTRDTDKEKLVISEAIKLMVEDGFQGFSMNKLAKACHISVATLYIYYKDKDDLIRKIGKDIGYEFFSNTLKDFSPTMSFRDGLRKQWENRAAFALEYTNEVICFEIIRHSPHGEEILQTIVIDFKEKMSQFFTNAINNNELIELPIEVFWSIAYGPLYTLLRFHSEGKSMAGKPFVFSDEIMYAAFELVLKALTPVNHGNE